MNEMIDWTTEILPIQKKKSEKTKRMMSLF